MEKAKQPKRSRGRGMVFGIAIGIAIGTAIGVATDNIGLWLAVGVAIGAGVGNSFEQKANKNNKEDTSEKK